MPVTYQRSANLQAAVIAWLASDATIVSLTGYNATTKPSGIYVSRGDDPLNTPPHLILDDCYMNNYLPDVDTIQEAFVHLSAYATDRLTALYIIGAVEALAQQDSSQRDASFASNGVRTMALQCVNGERSAGKSEFGVTAAHRTQVPVADVHPAGATLRIVFQET